MFRSVLGATALLLLASSGLHAQQPQYAASPRDTLRYDERTLDITTLDTPQGIVTQQSLHEALLALQLGANGNASAWYEQLALKVTTPQGERQGPPLNRASGLFALQLDARGRVTTTATPDFPAALDSLTDLRRQFDDFLIVLPDAPLFPGMEWSDSLSRQYSRGPGSSVNYAMTRTYRVARDTVTPAGTAWVIVTGAELNIESTTPAPGGTLQITSTQRGSESGVALWSRSGGRMLARTRSAELQGAVTITGGTEPIELPQLRRYESSLTLRP